MLKLDRLPKIERDSLFVKLMLLSRRASLFCLAICPLLLLYQLAEWTEVRFWADISLGSLLYPDPETAREFNTSRFRMLYDMLWIPMWFEFLVAAIVLFVAHMALWNYMDAKRSARRRARRRTSGPGSSGQRRRERR